MATVSRRVAVSREASRQNSLRQIEKRIGIIERDIAKKVDILRGSAPNHIKQKAAKERNMLASQLASLKSMQSRLSKQQFDREPVVTQEPKKEEPKKEEPVEEETTKEAVVTEEEDIELNDLKSKLMKYKWYIAGGLGTGLLAFILLRRRGN